MYNVWYKAQTKAQFCKVHHHFYEHWNYVKSLLKWNSFRCQSSM